MAWGNYPIETEPDEFETEAAKLQEAMTPFAQATVNREPQMKFRIKEHVDLAMKEQIETVNHNLSVMKNELRELKDVMLGFMNKLELEDKGKNAQFEFNGSGTGSELKPDREDREAEFLESLVNHKWPRRDYDEVEEETGEEVQEETLVNCDEVYERIYAYGFEKPLLDKKNLYARAPCSNRETFLRKSGKKLTRLNSTVMLSWRVKYGWP